VEILEKMRKLAKKNIRQRNLIEKKQLLAYDQSSRMRV